MGVEQLITKAEFDACLKTDKLVVVDFYATWCGPCKMISPKVEAMSQEFEDVAFYKVDVDENSETAESEAISAMPTFKLYKNGQQVDEVVGASEEKIRSAIMKLK